MNHTDKWSDGDAYEAYVGRWSRRVAVAFLDWLEPGTGWRWLDVGSGTGALSSTIVDRWEPRLVNGIDASAAYVAAARERTSDARVRFTVRDAVDLDFDGGFEAAVSGLVLNFVSDPAAAVRGMARALVPGGVAAAYVWDYAGRMEFMRAFWDAARTLDDGVRALDEGLRFPLCQPEPLAELWNAAQLTEVATTAIDVPTTFRDFDDLWMPFTGGQGPAPGYLRSLPAPAQDALREAVRAAVPVAADGSIALVARAWAVKGRTPAA